MDAKQLRRGQRVIVDHGEPRGENEAIVTEVPPFTRNVAGETRRVTDGVMVKYPSSTPKRLRSMGVGDLQEEVSLDLVRLP